MLQLIYLAPKITQTFGEVKENIFFTEIEHMFTIVINAIAGSCEGVLIVFVVILWMVVCVYEETSLF